MQSHAHLVRHWPSGCSSGLKTLDLGKYPNGCESSSSENMHVSRMMTWAYAKYVCMCAGVYIPPSISSYQHIKLQLSWHSVYYQQRSSTWIHLVCRTCKRAHTHTLSLSLSHTHIYIYTHTNPHTHAHAHKFTSSSWYAWTWWNAVKWSPHCLRVHTQTHPHLYTHIRKHTHTNTHTHTHKQPSAV